MKSNDPSATNVAPKKSIKSTECTHNYVEKVIAPTCTKQGYTLHTCKKCGKSYRDSYTAARHEYGKYLCLHCGRPDPSNPFNSLVAWLETNGSLAGNGAYSSIKYEKDGTIYSISTNIYYQNVTYFDFEKGEEIFRITLDNTDKCNIYYYHNQISGDAKLQKSKVCSSFPLNLNSFENNGSAVCSKQEFTAQMNNKIDSFLNIIQDKLLYPRTSLRLENFVFTAF
ncbi:MAG TPA: hypothetical protein VHO94_05195 [Oscillospiraceae bacterium]|nr:hypothetical protein [Oscillospiraceae bacterium]